MYTSPPSCCPQVCECGGVRISIGTNEMYGRDGLGTLASQWQSGHLAMTRSSIVLGLGSSAASNFGGGVVGTGNVSTGDDDEDDEGGWISIPENNNAQIPN
ncbi:hypothetical protein EWB00_000439, partial [Schistosoma japonicum]